MDSPSLLTYCKEKSNDGVSVWVFTGKILDYLCSQPRGIPKFNSNLTYVVVD